FAMRTILKEDTIYFVTAALVVREFRRSTGAAHSDSTPVVLFARVALGSSLRVIKFDAEMLIPAALVVHKLRRRSGVAHEYSIFLVLLADIALRFALRPLLE